MLIASKKQNKLVLYPLDFVWIPGLLYYVFGTSYAQIINYRPEAHVHYFYGGVVLLVVFRSQFVIKTQNKEFNKEASLLLLAIILGLLSILVFFASEGVNYFSQDKIQRSHAISKKFFLRVPFFVATILYVYVLIMYKKAIKNRILERLIFIFFLSILIIEGNRELLLIAGLVIILRYYRLRNICMVPSGILGVVVIAFTFIFVAFFFKPLFYFIILGKTYDGGWYNIGELVNWMRHEFYVDSRSIDITSIQRNDMQYLLQAIVLPFATVDSSSAVFFKEILGGDNSGRTYGYSGALWMSNYLPGYEFVSGIIILLTLFVSKFIFNKEIYNLLLIIFCIVGFRLFRSEWPLVLKTLNWNYLYPSVLVLLSIKLIIANNK